MGQLDGWIKEQGLRGQAQTGQPEVVGDAMRGITDMIRSLGMYSPAALFHSNDVGANSDIVGSNKPIDSVREGLTGEQPGVTQNSVMVLGGLGSGQIQGKKAPQTNDTPEEIRRLGPEYAKQEAAADAKQLRGMAAIIPPNSNARFKLTNR